MLGPVLETETFHNQSIEYQCKLLRDMFVGLEFIEFIKQKQGSPGINIVLRAILFFVLLLESLLLKLRSFPVYEKDVHR